MPLRMRAGTVSPDLGNDACFLFMVAQPMRRVAPWRRRPAGGFLAQATHVRQSMEKAKVSVEQASVCLDLVPMRRKSYADRLPLVDLRTKKLGLLLLAARSRLGD